MKRKLLCFCLSFVLLLSSIVCVNAETPYSKHFDNKESMLKELSEYSASFPNVEDYYVGDLKENRPNMHIEYKNIIIPEISNNAYLADTYNYAESSYGSGVNYMFVSYSGTNDRVRFIVYYQMNKKQIEENLTKFGDDNSAPTAPIYKGTVKSIGYAACENANEDGTFQCEYKLAVGGSLVVVYTEKPFNSKFIEDIEFEATDILLPVFVDNYDGYNEKENILGDADEDGVLSVLDATAIQMNNAKMLDFTPEQLDAADVDGDGVVSTIDATSIQMYIAKMITSFPVETQSN